MKNKKGFTLIELLAVIVIVAIIATIGVFAVTKIMDNARINSLKDTALAVKKTAKLYETNNDLTKTTTILNMTPDKGSEESLIDLDKDPWGKPYEAVVATITKESDELITFDIYLQTNKMTYSLTETVVDNQTTVTESLSEPIPNEILAIMNPIADILIVGGGGGGCEGGGGGGGFVTATENLSTARSINVVVGAGGAGSYYNTTLGEWLSPTAGNNSSFSSLIAYGGGAGGCHESAGGDGASGGGGGASGILRTGGMAIYGEQGYPGGSNAWSGDNYLLEGGGGGAGGSGGIGSGIQPGNGGPGRLSNITGTNTYYAGGGGGGGWYWHFGNGTGGIGGGGDAGAPAGIGSPNTGGGGGGAGHESADGADGGSGIVIIRYLKDAVNATGGIISYDGDYKIHTFNSSGTFVVQ